MLAMAFGQQSGPPASHRQMQDLTMLLENAGHTDFRSGIAAESDAILIPEIPVDFDVLYEHCKERFFERVSNSDVKAGTYLVIVAEGLKDSSGEELFDESAGVDSFGHKRLAGAGKYVVHQLTKRFKADQSVTDLMKKEKMYVKDLYEVPEVRGVNPGHLVRCGHSSVYDVNFGKEAGGDIPQVWVTEKTDSTGQEYLPLNMVLDQVNTPFIDAMQNQ